VEESDPFSTLPAPVAGVVTLDPDTYYVFCGNVNVGNNRIFCPPSSVIAGKDPLVDSVIYDWDGSPPQSFINFPEGGTLKDLGLRLIRPPISEGPGPRAIEVGASGNAGSNCVIFNSSINAFRVGVFIPGSGAVDSIDISRQFVVNTETAVQIGTNSRIPAVVGSILIQNQFVIGTSTGFSRGLQFNNCAVASAAFLGNQFVANTGSCIGIQGQAAFSIDTFRIASSSFDRSSAPAAVPSSFGLGVTTENQINTNAVNCVGYPNSVTRASTTVFNVPTQPNPGPGIYVPVGLGVPVAPLFVLSPSSVRFVLDGATTSSQVLRYIGLDPYVSSINVNLTAGISAGFITAPRIIGVRLLKNGAVLPAATWTGGLAPGAIGQTAAAISFTVAETLDTNDELSLEVSNLTDLAPLLITGAQIAVT